MKLRFVTLLVSALLLSGAFAGFLQFGAVAQSPTDYVLYLDFDEGTGSEANDLSPNDLDGRLIADAGWVEGVSGNCVRFDGLADRVEVPDSDAIDFGNNDRFSISLWARSSGSDGDQVLFSKVDGRGYYANIVDGNESFVIDEGTTLSWVPFQFDFDNQWHHLVFMRETSVLSVWIDGTLHDEAPENTLADISNPANLSIGGEAGSNSASITGRIDDFRIYDRELTTSEIRELYTEKTRPSAPQNLAATHGYEEVTLEWQAPVSDGMASITNYRIYRGTLSGHTSMITEINNVLTWTDTGLVNDETYYYNVTAVNNYGEGPSSAEVSATPSDRPTAPRNLAANPGDGQVTLTWQAPVSDGGSGIQNYTVYRGTASGSLTMLVELGNVLTYTDTGLTSGQEYFYQISATNINGEGTLSAEVGATPFGPPTRPTNLQTNAGDGFVRVTWNAPVSDGGSPVTNYVIYRGSSPAGMSLLANVGNVLQYDDTTVVNDQTYYYTVSAVNANGEGARATEVSAFPSATPPVEDGEDNTMLIVVGVVAVLAIIFIIVLLPRLTGKPEEPEEELRPYEKPPEPEIPYQYTATEEAEEPESKPTWEQDPDERSEPSEEEWPNKPPEEQGIQEYPEPTEPQADGESSDTQGPAEKPGEKKEGEQPRY